MQQFGHQRRTWSRGEDELGVSDQECVFTCVAVLVTVGESLLVIVKGDLSELMLLLQLPGEQYYNISQTV